MSTSTSTLAMESVTSITRTVDGSVDVFDVSARLESKGLGDGQARLRGFKDVFEFAAETMRSITTRDASPPRVETRLHEALFRSLFLFAGAILCISSLSVETPTTTTIYAGVGSWITAMVTSSVLWKGLSSGRRNTSSSAALIISAVFVALAAACSIYVGDLSVITWTMWGFASASGMVDMRVRTLSLIVTASAALASLSHLWLGETAHIPGIVLVFLLFCLMVFREYQQSRAALTKFTFELGLTAIQAVFQVAALVAVLLMLMQELGPESIAVIVAGFTVSALGGPLLETGATLVRWVATRTSSYLATRWLSAVVGMANFIFTVLVGMTGGIIVTWLFIGPLDAIAIVASLLMSVLAAGASMLLATGSQHGALWLSVVSALVIVLLPELNTESMAVCATVISLVAISLAGVRYARPLAWSS